MRAKKSLGQNFLNSPSITRQIVEAASVRPDVAVLEIGPGKGALTKEILNVSGNVLAIEADVRMVEHLQELFSDEITAGALTLIHDDIMDWDESTLRNSESSYQIIANIPYYLTGILLRKFLTSPCHPVNITFVVQKEIAQRIIAQDGKHSLLSLSVQVFGTPSMPLKISRRFFSPSPKVDSAVIHIADISHDRFKNTQEADLFFQLIKAGFAHKRKILASNLQNIIPKETLLDIFEVRGISPKVRAEDLSLDDWLFLLSGISR
jgi:16S rRNA (adenine1518-N6/adenine1519-N6)-dimethyltransferase